MQAKSIELPDIYKSVRQLIEQKNIPAAEAILRLVVQHHPQEPDALILLGDIFFHQKKLQLALQVFMRASETVQNTHIFNQIGRIYDSLEKYDQALIYFEKITKKDPNFGPAWLNVGKIHHQERRFEQALPYYEKARSLMPNNSAVYNNLGSLYRVLRRYDDAIESFKKALKLEPKSAGVLYNLGNLMRDAGKPEEAVQYFEKSLQLDPHNAVVHWNQALTYLLAGDLPNGFDKYRWRWKYDKFPTKPRIFKEPEWDGSSFNGKTLLIHLEQGMGDLMQFIRFIPEVVKKKGKTGKIILECHAPLKSILATMPGIDFIIEREDKHPPFDYQIAPMTLPCVLGTTLETLPRKVPYLFVPPDNKFKVPKEILNSGNLKVGIVWAGNPKHGNDRHRSSRLKDWLPIFDLPGISYFSLQKGECESQIEELGLTQKFMPIGPLLNEFADTAKVINELDIIISVDTSVAHLAGALGKPVWVLVPQNPDWRWMLNREDSPWYPSARVFRQNDSREWVSILPSLTKALKEEADKKKAGFNDDAPRKTSKAHIIHSKS